MTKPHITKRGGKWLLIDGRGTTVCDTFELASGLAAYRHRIVTFSFSGRYEA